MYSWPNPLQSALTITPQPLDENVVAPAALALHALARVDACSLGNELGAAELAALVGVDDLERAVAQGRLAQRLNAAVRLHRDGHAALQHPTVVQVQHGHPVHPAARYRDVGDVQRPGLVGPLDGDVAQQVRELRVCRVLATGVGLADLTNQ